MKKVHFHKYLTVFLIFHNCMAELSVKTLKSILFFPIFVWHVFFKFEIFDRLIMATFFILQFCFSYNPSSSKSTLLLSMSSLKVCKEIYFYLVSVKWSMKLINQLARLRHIGSGKIVLNSNFVDRIIHWPRLFFCIVFIPLN